MAIEPTGPLGPHHPAGPRQTGDVRTVRAEPGRPRKAPAAVPREDSIELSPEARDLASLGQADRERRIQQIRDQVALGAYRVDADAVAREMLDRGDA